MSNIQKYLRKLEALKAKKANAMAEPKKVKQEKKVKKVKQEKQEKASKTSVSRPRQARYYAKKRLDPAFRESERLKSAMNRAKRLHGEHVTFADIKGGVIVPSVSAR